MIRVRHIASIAALAVIGGCQSRLTDAQIDQLAEPSRSEALAQREAQDRATDAAAKTAIDAGTTIGGLLPPPWNLIVTSAATLAGTLLVQRRYRPSKKENANVPPQS